MIITLVMDQFEEGNNGTTLTTRRFAEELAKFGHEVRILCGKGSCNFKLYETGELKYPFKRIVHKEGMIFARYNKKIAYEAIKDSDLVQFF